MIQNFADHSANERTFLAWVRTAIAVMAFGFVVERFDLSMANYMDASRMARFSWRDDRQIRLQVYIRPVDAGQSLRALMDFADPRLILLESSKLDSPYRLGGSRSDLFAITRC
jgi:Domain of unknown function (DUF202)